jgi:hypothetical protein
MVLLKHFWKTHTNACTSLQPRRRLCVAPVVAIQASGRPSELFSHPWKLCQNFCPKNFAKLSVEQKMKSQSDTLLVYKSYILLLPRRASPPPRPSAQNLNFYRAISTAGPSRKLIRFPDYYSDISGSVAQMFANPARCINRKTSTSSSHVWPLYPNALPLFAPRCSAAS